MSSSMRDTSTEWASDLLDLLFDDPAAGHCLVSPEGTVRRASPEWLRSVGCTLDEAVGRNIVEILPAEEREVAPAMLARARAGTLEIPPHVHRMHGQETWWAGSIAPVPIEGGTGLLITIREINCQQQGTTLERAEAALRHSQELLAQARQRAAEMDAVFESIADGLLVCGPTGEVVRANSAVEQMLGLAKGAARGCFIHDMVRQAGVEGPDGHPLAPQETASQRALRGEVVRGTTQVVQRGDGKRSWLSVSAAPIRSGAEIIGAVVSFTDRTEERHATEALREAGRRKDEFLGMLSHELRNPLAPIRNSVYILEHAEPMGEQAARARNVIHRQTEHLTRLVDDLLDVTRIARGKIELRRERVDLRDVVRRTADDFRSMMEDRGITLRTVLADAKVWADADPTRITQVIGNLLHNAGKFTRRGGEVTLSLQVRGGMAEISVRDTGAGIEPEVLPLVFDAFVQGERTLARTEGGLGLGLALVKGITELHGGTVRAASAGSGQGTEFVVRLPAAVAMQVEASVQRTARGAHRGGRRVLVVDDNRDAAESLAEIVEMLGHLPDVAYDGPSAIEKARANSPEIVLCDIGLPGMSGYDVARTLRAEGSGPMQLIAVSGYAQPEDLKAAIDAGFDRHIAKPASLAEIERLLG